MSIIVNERNSDWNTMIKIPSVIWEKASCCIGSIICLAALASNYENENALKENHVVAINSSDYLIKSIYLMALGTLLVKVFIKPTLQLNIQNLVKKIAFQAIPRFIVYIGPLGISRLRIAVLGICIQQVPLVGSRLLFPLFSYWSKDKWDQVVEDPIVSFMEEIRGFST